MIRMNFPCRKKTGASPLAQLWRFFKKIIIVDGNQKYFSDENGAIVMGVIPFLLDKGSLEN